MVSALWSSPLDKFPHVEIARGWADFKVGTTAHFCLCEGEESGPAYQAWEALFPGIYNSQELFVATQKRVKEGRRYQALSTVSTTASHSTGDDSSFLIHPKYRPLQVTDSQERTEGVLWVTDCIFPSGLWSPTDQPSYSGHRMWPWDYKCLSHHGQVSWRGVV